LLAGVGADIWFPYAIAETLAATGGLVNLGALYVLLALAALGAGIVRLPDGLDDGSRFEILMWGPGHVLQRANVAFVLVAWALLAAWGSGRRLGEHRADACRLRLRRADLRFRPAHSGPLPRLHRCGDARTHGAHPAAARCRVGRGRFLLSAAPVGCFLRRGPVRLRDRPHARGQLWPPPQDLQRRVADRPLRAGDRSLGHGGRRRGLGSGCAAPVAGAERQVTFNRRGEARMTAWLYQGERGFSKKSFDMADSSFMIVGPRERSPRRLPGHPA
jgi:hypothetical protein